MAWFEAEHTTRFTTPVGYEAARDHFASLEQIIAQSADVEQAEVVDQGTISFLLKEQNHGITTFQGRYTCRYTLADEHTLVWQTVGEGHNMTSEGRATFQAEGELCAVDYTEKLGLDLDVPAMVVPMLKPVIRQVLAAEMAKYVERMTEALEA